MVQKMCEQAYIYIYISLIMSRLEYCAASYIYIYITDYVSTGVLCSILGSASGAGHPATRSHVHVQRIAVRFVAQDFSRYSSVTLHLSDLKWTPLKDPPWHQAYFLFFQLYIYISLIMSRLEYCAASWDPHLEQDIQQLKAMYMYKE